MSVELVTAEEVRAHLRLDEPADGDDPNELWIETFILSVSAAVAAWLKDDWRLYVPLEDSNGVVVDSDGAPVPSADIQPIVKAAALIEIASQFRFREGEGTNVVPATEGHGYMLSKGATALLVGLRRTTVR